MRTKILIVLIFFWSSPASAMAQLPPEILADSYLLRVEQAIRDGDQEQARDEFDKIILLHRERQLNLSEEFLFRYAKAAVVVDRPDLALESVTKFLTVAGRESPNYVEALELMNQTQDIIAGRKEAKGVSPRPPSATPITEGPTEAVREAGETTDGSKDHELLLDVSGTPEVHKEPACDLENWNTKEYFKAATLEYVRTCLEAGTDVATSTEDGHTPLHMAAQYNEDPAVVRALLAHGADLNAKATTDGHTPLHEAAASNPNPDVLQALLAAGADPMARDRNGASLLCWAARNGNSAVIEILLKTGIDPEAPDEHGYTPLHWAARNNKNPEVLKVLLTAGSDLMARANDGRTPLHSAALGNGSLGVFQVLLAAGANVTARTEKDYSPLHWAAGNAEKPAVIKLLLAAGADLEAGKDTGWTPLQWAATFNQNPDILKTLIVAGANLNVRDGGEDTPLHNAAQNNQNPDVVKALLAAGATLEGRSNNGSTPLIMAAWGNKNPDVLQELLAAGAKVNARMNDGRTPLHNAAQNNQNPDVIRALLTAGAALMARDEDGDTPLHMAARGNKNPEALKVLLASGDPMARNASGKTPWDLAQDNSALKGSEAYWLLNDARFGAGSGTASTSSASTSVAGPGSNAVVPKSRGQCEIPGYPRPANVQNLGFSWCPCDGGFSGAGLCAAGGRGAVRDCDGQLVDPGADSGQTAGDPGGLCTAGGLGVSNCRCP